MLEHPGWLVLPIATLTLVSYAYFSRYMRSSAIDTLAQDYIRTARAKGLPERLVLLRHLLRNSLLTVVTLVGLSIPLIITGTLIIEQVFNFPGRRLEYFNAAQNNDYEVMLGITVLIGVITVLGNLMADIGYATARSSDQVLRRVEERSKDPGADGEVEPPRPTPPRAARSPPAAAHGSSSCAPSPRTSWPSSARS